MWTEIERDMYSITYAMQVYNGCIIRVRTMSSFGVADSLVYAPGIKLEDGKIISTAKH